MRPQGSDADRPDGGAWRSSTSSPRPTSPPSSPACITDDFTSEFDPFSPQFGEKFAPPDLPVSVKDWTGNEISRVYADQWGAYNGLTYSTWEVNPPNPTGYSPTMMVIVHERPGRSAARHATDPLFNPAYSQFCYELPFMPGQTAYLDTPVVPTSAFSARATTIPTAPTRTPRRPSAKWMAMAVGPWVSARRHSTLTITALGDQPVNNYGVLRALGHHGSVQPEDRHPPLWLWRHARRTVALIGTVGVTAPVTAQLERHARSPSPCPAACRPAPSSSRRSTAALQPRSAASWSSRPPTASNRSTP